MKRQFFIRKFIMFISLTLIPICVFGGISASYINMQVKKEAGEKAQGTTALMRQYMGELTDYLEFYRISLVSNPRLHLALMNSLNSERMDTEDFSDLTEATRLLYYFQSTKPYIQSVYLTIKGSPYFINGVYRENFETAADGSWESEAEEISENTFMRVRNVKRNKFDTATVPVVSLYQRLKYNELMMINIRQEYFNTWLDSVTDYDSQVLFITDSSGQILFQNKNTGLLPEKLQERIREYLAADTSESFAQKGYFCNSGLFPGNYDLHYFSLIPDGEVFRLSNVLLGLTAAAAILSILFSSALAYVYTMQDYRQIFQIIDLFDRAEKGMLKPEEAEGQAAGKNTAYFHIVNNIIRLFMSQTYLKVQLDAKKYALSTAQLSALQYQLNPHFLFNTLQSIDLEILKLTKRPTAANRMISSLSELLRYSLSGPTHRVSLGEEIAATKNYIELQNLRTGEPFRVIWQYKEELLSVPMLKLLLQPIIENSITHCGLESVGKLVVKIRIYQEGPYLKLAVIDNGLGMEKSQLVKLQEQINDDNVEQSGRHIGLKNIGQRVRLAYSHGYIKLWSKAGMGTVVVIGGIEKQDRSSTL